MEILGRAAAIRARCLDCCCYQPAEVRKCPVKDCALRPYRRGHLCLDEDFPGEDVTLQKSLSKSEVYDINGRVKGKHMPADFRVAESKSEVS